MRHFDSCLDYELIAGFDRKFTSLRGFVERAIHRYPRIDQASRAVQTAVISVLANDLWHPRYGDSDVGESAADDERVLDAVKLLDPALQPLSANLMWTMAAYSRTNRCYRVTEGLAHRLIHTELRGIHAGDLRLPYPAIYIEIPRSLGLKIWNNESGWHPLVGCYVVEEPEPDRRWWIMCWGEPKGEIAPGVADDALVYWAMRLHNDQWTVDQIIADTARPKPHDIRVGLWEIRYQYFNSQPWPDIFRWVMNLMIYVTSADARLALDPLSEKAYRERQRGRTPDKRRAAEYRWRRLGHTMVAGQGMAPLEHYDPTVQTRVTGHWRRVVYGEGRSGRKIKWIQPYWRGPTDAPISQTQHAV